MVKIDSSKRVMILDLDYRPGRRLADLVLQTIWSYAASSEEDKAYIRNMADAIAGRVPLSDLDLMEITSSDEAKLLYSPLNEGKND